MFIHSDVPISGATPSRKRKRGTYDTNHDTVPFDFGEFEQKPILIRPDPDHPFHHSRCFVPIALVRRADLSLAYLDARNLHDRFASAYVPILEECHDHGIFGRILVAEERDGNGLYAFERIAQRRCAIMRLASWLPRAHFKKLGTVSALETASKHCKMGDTAEGDSPWWSSIVVSAPSSQIPAPAHDKSVHCSRMDSETSKPIPARPMQEELTGGPELAKEDAQIYTIEASSVPTPTEHFQELSRQYLDALYVSRTPLAFFAKGPLSRARAAFSGSSGTDCHVSVLTSFLRQCILSVSTMDKKYRQEILRVVKDTNGTEPTVGVQASKKKRKRKWKPKRDGSGMFTDEVDHIERWWQSDIDAGGHAEAQESLDVLVQRRARRLRSRETYLQIILALETLALESSIPADDAKARGAADEMSGEGAASAERPTAKTSKVKQFVDLASALEAMAERLCIWHSIDGQTANESNANEQSARANGSMDELRDFCVEIIMPFFQGRVPREASMINAKLGGPQAPTPKIKRTSSARRPGEPTVRRGTASDASSSLKRQSSHFPKAASRHVPTLQRSATDTIVEAQIKTEPSDETSLGGIPRSVRRLGPGASSRIRPRFVEALGFHGRQVDLSAMSQASEAKARKKAEMDEKLRDAVAAIKKPNRSLALEDVAQKTDLSFAKALSSSTRPTHTNKRKASHTQQAVIEATPKHKRVIGATPARSRMSSTTIGNGSSRSDCEMAVVPMSSATRPTSHASGGGKTSFAVPATGHRVRFGQSATVDETPSRGFAKFMPSLLSHQPGTLNESPTAQRQIRAIEQTPVRPIAIKGLFSSGKIDDKGVSTGQGVPEDTSIYDSLGWNDDEEYETLT